jgi:hypothetical protein
MPVRERTRSLACKSRSTQASHHRHAETSGIPCTMELTAYTRSPRCPGLLATVVGVMRSIVANVIPASGDQDHAISPHASGLARLALPKASIASRAQRP